MHFLFRPYLLLAFESTSLYQRYRINCYISSTRSSNKIIPRRLPCELLFLAPPGISLHGLRIQHRSKQPKVWCMCGDCLEIGADLVKFLGCCLLAESLTLVFGTIVGGLTTALYRDESRASQIFSRLL